VAKAVDGYENPLDRKAREGSSPSARTNFPRSYFYPEGRSFARSDPLFPSAELSAAITIEYEGQCFSTVTGESGILQQPH
jgi:hypothetical protein